MLYTMLNKISLLQVQFENIYIQRNKKFHHRQLKEKLVFLIYKNTPFCQLLSFVKVGQYTCRHGGL